jgi:hypothetical protein
MKNIKFALAGALVAGFASAAAADGADYTVGNFETVAARVLPYAHARAEYIDGGIQAPAQWFEQVWFDRGSNVPNG